MSTILVTGATDGIGLLTATMLAEQGHRVLLHGRSEERLAAALASLPRTEGIEPLAFRADLSRLSEVVQLAEQVSDEVGQLDVLINNAGVFKLAEARSPEGLDLRFVVNTLAPYVLTQRLLPALSARGRVVNLASAAQAPVDLDALAGRRSLDDSAAYAQSKLGLIMWTRHLAASLGADAPMVVAMNPASFLASKMVRSAYGVEGKDLSVGAEVLVGAVLDASFADASGKYFDNDAGQFAAPHPEAMHPERNEALIGALDALAQRLLA